MSLIPKDVAAQLPGKWQVSYLGRTRNGSPIDYKATWEFDENGGVRSIDAKAEGKWVYDWKNRRIVVSWENKEESSESFPVPLTPNGLVGKTWHGAGVKFTASKELSE